LLWEKRVFGFCGELWLVPGSFPAFFGLLANIFGNWEATEAKKWLVKTWWEDGETW